MQTVPCLMHNVPKPLDPPKYMYVVHTCTKYKVSGIQTLDHVLPNTEVT